MDDYDYNESEICYECEGLGDDYYFDDSGELVCACQECAFYPYLDDED